MSILHTFRKPWRRTDDRYVRTPNLDLAAILLCQGCTLVNVDRTDPTHCQFVFRDSFEVQELVARFESRCVIMVAVSRFLFCYKTLRRKLTGERF